MVQRGCESATAPADEYNALLESRPQALVCFPEYHDGSRPDAAAVHQVRVGLLLERHLAQGDAKDPNWRQSFDNLMHQDRFFCGADQAILTDVRAGKGNNFFQEADPGLGATAMLPKVNKQTQFDVAKVQPTFHGNDTCTLPYDSSQPVKCVKIAPRIDYYRDVAAHGLLELIPNWINKAVAGPAKGSIDPGVVYALRRMTTRLEGVPDFNPLCR
jgi:hypothetical protein